ncbi:MAG: efflux RND transporter periplasmic adaptor subunit [Bacteroidota bacterium]
MTRKNWYTGLLIYAGLTLLLLSCGGTKNEQAEEETTDFRTPVRVKVLGYEKFDHFIEVTGSVEAIYDAYISPEMNGQIKKIFVSEGDYVRAGQTLAILNTEVTQKGIEELKTGLDLATTLFEKQKELWDQGIGSEVQYLQAKNQKEALEKKLETLQAQLRMSTITAPFDGIVDNILQKEGELGTPGRQLMQVVNLSQLKINADVSEAFIPVVHKGDTVRISFPTYPDIIVHAPVNRTSNVIKSGNRTFEVELRMNNIDGKLKPNLISLLQINDYSKDSALVVPSIIVKNDMKGSFLFTTENTDSSIVAKKVYVKTGKSFGDKTEILKGLKTGDKVIVEGYTQVSNGSEIEIK